MPTHLDSMTARLPHLYREGELVTSLLRLAAIQMEIAEEDAREVQRAHWFDTTLDLGEAGRLAAPLDIAVEEWQFDLGEFRGWAHAIRDARLRRGAVTVAALEGFVVEYATAYQRAVRTRVLPETLAWGDRTNQNELVFLENPPRRRINRQAGPEPLARFTVTNGGLDETPAAFLFVGLPDGPESVPVIANLTTGQALVFLGNVGPGERLALRPAAPGAGAGDPGGDLGVVATLEGVDVSDRLRSIDGLVPGSAWTTADAPARAIGLARGENEMWFLPVAHYDALGIDRFLLALADLLMTQGRWDGSFFDRALFYQAPAVSLFMTWVEREPAAFEVRLPAAMMAGPAGQFDESLAERDRLGLSLDRAIGDLRAAGVRAAVVLDPFSEIQPSGDLVRIIPVPRVREVGPTGADRMPDAGGVFEVTGYNDSTYR